MTYRFAFFILSIVILMLPATAKADMGVAVGDTIPHMLELKDQYGVERQFDDLKGEKGLVLVFIRSADWCPYCQEQLIDLGQRGHEIENLGYDLVALSYDSPEQLMQFTKKYDFQYTLLSDPNSNAIKAFGILNTEIPEGSSYHGIPHPGIYVININGVIRERLFEEGYKNRPPVDQITATIEAIR